MFKVKGRLSNSKAFAFDSPANTLQDAFADVGRKVTPKVPKDVEITALSFLKRGPILTDVVMSDVKKRKSNSSTQTAAAR